MTLCCLVRIDHGCFRTPHTLTPFISDTLQLQMQTRYRLSHALPTPTPVTKGGKSYFTPFQCTQCKYISKRPSSTKPGLCQRCTQSPADNAADCSRMWAILHLAKNGQYAGRYIKYRSFLSECLHQLSRLQTNKHRNTFNPLMSVMNDHPDLVLNMHNQFLRLRGDY